MPLFEKAFSKYMGDYDRIQGGTGYESLRTLSNKPIFYWNHESLKDPRGLFTTLHKLAKNKHHIVVGCCRTSGDAPDGLTNQHAYSLLDVIEVQGEKLAKMRNPWSVEGYNGPWSDNDPRWTPALLKQVGHEKANDGVFFMPFKNYLVKPYFTQTSAAIWKEFKNKKDIYNIVQTVQ